MLTGFGRLALMISSLVLAGVASAVPVRYSFTSGTQVGSGGSVQGQFGPNETAFGTFTYEADSPSIGKTPFQHGDADIYASIFDWEGFVGGRRFFDQYAGTLVGNDVATNAVDTFRLTGSVAGGNWEPFDVNGQTLVRVQIIFQEALFGTPDFLDSNAQPGAIPDFIGLLRLDFGGDANNPTGFVQYGNVRVQRVPVPEPGVWLLWFMGASLLIALTMSRRRVAGAAT